MRRKKEANKKEKKFRIKLNKHKNKSMKTLYVSDVDGSITNQQLMDHFSQCGHVLNGL